MSATLGIDIGTFEAKGVIVADDGTVLASATRRHELRVPRPGHAEHDPRADWWDAVTELANRLVREASLSPRDIRAVGVSAIGPCLLAVDKAGEPLMNAILYSVDGRAVDEITELTARIGLERLMAVCGNPLTTQSVGPKIAWLKRHRPDVWANAARLHTSTSWLVEKLTGHGPIDQYTAANFGPVYDIRERCWTSDLAPDLVDLDKLPKLAWTTDIAGTVTTKAAAETGLAAGTPVIVGSVDAAAEAVSVGVREPGDMMMMYGSSIFIIEVTKTLCRDPRLWTAPWLFPGQSAAMASLATAGTITRWFQRELARDLVAETAIPALAAEAATSPPGARGLLMLPWFAGAQTPWFDPAMRGAILGLDLTHTRADMARAMLEGIGHAVGVILDTYREAGEPPREVFAVGGGTRNIVWRQAISDIGGVPQTLRRNTFGASYGDAFMAAHAIGAVPLGAIAAWNPTAESVFPSEQAATYDEPKRRFRALSGHLRN